MITSKTCEICQASFIPENTTQKITSTCNECLKQIFPIKKQKEVNMGKIIVPNAVERKSGYLYYIDGEGNLCESAMKRNKAGAKKKIKPKKK